MHLVTGDGDRGAGYGLGHRLPADEQSPPRHGRARLLRILRELGSGDRRRCRHVMGEHGRADQHLAVERPASHRVLALWEGSGEVLHRELRGRWLPRLEEHPCHGEIVELATGVENRDRSAPRIEHTELRPPVVVERAMHAHVIVGRVELDDQLGRVDLDGATRPVLAHAGQLVVPCAGGRGKRETATQCHGRHGHRRNPHYPSSSSSTSISNRYRCEQRLPASALNPD